MRISACNLSIVPLRAEPDHRSEMVSQLLFGECFKILEEGIDFVKIRTLDSNYEGWMQKQQFGTVDFATEATSTIVDLQGAQALAEDKTIFLVPGTRIRNQTIHIGNDTFKIEGALRQARIDDFEQEFKRLCQYYLQAPYMWGGRSIFGIDCSGFSQAVCGHFGLSLPRDAYQQAETGVTVDFLTEIKAGDLAFFDNEQGKITHVGVMLDKENIIHASAQVRIDKMDSHGIFNAEQNRYTHKLRIVKRYF